MDKKQNPPESPRIVRLPPVSKHDPEEKRRSTKMALTTEEERKDMQFVLGKDDRLKGTLTSTENLLHALKVVASIQPKDRFSTTTGIHIDTAPEDRFQWSIQWAKRTLWNREGREKNLQVLTSLFIAAFVNLEEALEEREKIGRTEPKSRMEVVAKLKNTQRLNRVKKAVENAKAGIEHLKETYSDDTNTRALINNLNESIEDRLNLAETSVTFLDKETK
jgi:hypothetical protein